jgi:hypothetical protein
MSAGITIPTQAYCTLTDVQGLLPNRVYTSASKPTMEQAETNCKLVAKEINAICRGLGFTVPMTNANDISTLQLINMLGAAWMCESGTLVGVQGTSDIANGYKTRYDTMIKNLQSGVYKFEGAGAVPSAEPDGQTDLISSGTRSEPIFRISTDERERQF